MHPILFEIGGFAIPTYGAILALSFLFSVYLLRKEAARLGLDPQQVADAAIISLLVGLIGSKLLLILVDLPYYLENPAKLWGTIRSAGVMYGGVIAGALAVIWYVRRKGLPLWDTMDVMSPFCALGVGLGRLGCFMVGCCYGMPHDGPLAVIFPDHPYCEAPAGVGLFPIQLVSFAAGVALFGVLLAMLRKRRFSGQIVAAYFVLYSIIRGVIEFFRGDTVRGLWFGETISTSQIIALVGLLLGTWLYLKRRKDAKGE